jgi:peptide/nickel transport system permease protein
MSNTPVIAAKVQTPFRRICSQFAESPVAIFGLFMLLVVIAIAVLAPWISPQDPYDLANLNLSDGRLEPFSTGTEGYFYWLGSDDQGRDLIAAIQEIA